jgi:ferredoxin
MPTVKNFFGLLEKIQSADITVHQNRCAVVRNRNAKCMKCAEVCTSGCISYDDNELIITPDLCIGCGTCATVCPTCALEAHRPNDAELLHQCLGAMRANDGEVVIACEEITSAAEGLFDPEKVVSVRCLGRVEESLLATLAVAGAKHVSLVEGKCNGCEHVTGFHMAERVRDTSNTLLGTWNNDMKVDLVPKFPAAVRQQGKAAFDADKRKFFTDVKSETKLAANATADYAITEKLGIEDESQKRFQKVMDDGTLPHFVPDRRERLLNALAALGEPQDVMIETRLWGHVIIDPDKCSSCQMCATFCPTGAISKFTDEDGTFGVEHFPGDCVKCRCCTDICPKEALTLSDEVFAVDLLSGAVDRYEMKPLAHPIDDPHQIWYTMRDLLGSDQIYER